MINSTIQIPILCYHRVHTENDPATPAVVAGDYCGHVTKAVFSRHMKMLAESGFETVTHHEIMRWLVDGVEFACKKPIAIDFDDNRLNVLENAFPIMKEYGFKGTVFVISELASGNLPDMAQFPAMHWDHLSRLKIAGWTIGAHTASHANLGSLYDTDGGPEKVERELKQCGDSIKHYLGVDTPNFAYPNGNWSEQVETIVKKHYRTARLWQNDFGLTYNTQQTNSYRLQAVNISMQTLQQDFEKLLTRE